MPTLHVCPLSRLQATALTTKAGSLVTFMTLSATVKRPEFIPAARHLFIGISDIVEPMEGHVLPGEEHVTRLLEFVSLWDQQSPLLLHCYAGISRSTAGAYIAACALNPRVDEEELAQRLRTASPSATPNAKLIAAADAVLGREGRMVSAIASIGRGAEAFEGEPFTLLWD